MNCFHSEHELMSLEQNGISLVSCSTPRKHTYDVRGIEFTVLKRYKLIKVIGVGAYGVVVSGLDLQTGTQVAIKRICSAFEEITDAKRILREIRLMRLLRHENVRTQ